MNLVSGFHALGTLMAVGIMVLPAAAARFWSSEIDELIGISVGFAIFASIVGLLLSFHFSLPSGPGIILVAGMMYISSLILGPVGGILTRKPGEINYEN